MVDIGANLAHKSYAKMHDKILRSSLQAGVRTVITLGTSRNSSVEGLRLCENAQSGLYFCFLISYFSFII